MKPSAKKDPAKLFETLSRSGLAFAFYRLPDSKTIKHIHGTISRKLPANQETFVLAPFAPSAKPYYIIPSEITDREASLSLPLKKVKNTTKSHYQTLVKQIKAAVREGEFEKVVAARTLGIATPALFDTFSFFKKLCDHYPHAFVSLTYLPGIGLWIGASPEVLVKQDKSKLITYSLAGTRRGADTSPWATKELEEQAVVTKFIHSKLQKLSSQPIRVKGPITSQAGSLRHLLTVFTIQKETKGKWADVVKALHPTPAVSGLPQSKAISFIRSHEGFDRSFYAGYIGPISADGQADLFVNLRCMEQTQQQLVFYAGCGVNGDSSPEQEWLESEAKINVLRSLL